LLALALITDPPLLSLRDWSIGFGNRAVVRELTLEVHAGEVVALVGESGSGKSLTAMSVLGLLPRGARVTAGGMSFEGRDIAPPAMRALRGAGIGMVFQEPMTALNPALRVGEQIAEGLVRHRGLSWARAGQAAIDMLDRVGIPEPARRARQYVHQLSGGMRQRVMIATAIICRPRLLVADEPTTALDVTIQAQILALFRDLQQEAGMGVLFITHDLAVVAEVADRICVMHQGRIVEQGAVDAVLANPATAYTRGLLDALPGGSGFGDMRRGGPAGTTPLLEVRGLTKRFPVSSGLLGAGRRQVAAVDSVNFDVRRGEVLALVGESGSGKTTIGRCVLNLLPPSEGTLRFDGQDLATVPRAGRKELRRRMQIVFQDPFASLNPRLTVSHIIGEAIVVHGLAKGAAVAARVAALLELVGLDPAMATRRPHAFSGGQRQRIAIARALALEPELLVADEAVSALDVSVRAQIIRLLAELRERLGLTLLFITHDLGLVRYFADRVVVLYLGRVMEAGPVEAVFGRPAHPYTAALLASEPHLDPALRRAQPALSGDLPSPIDPPSGCVFRTRCPQAQPACAEQRPPLSAASGGDGHEAACLFPLQG
jgi:peptide/nickel transport system ATP-binding protein